MQFYSTSIEYNLIYNKEQLMNERILIIEDDPSISKLLQRGLAYEGYNVEQNRRHDVLPGLTGWAQINGRNAISWDEKFKLDVWYVDHQSFWLDLKIMALTLLKVIMKEGISQPGHATSEEFMGNDKI